MDSASRLVLLLAGLASSCSTVTASNIIVPDWNQTMPHKEYCIDVPDVFNGTAVHNNSRWAFVAEPAGTVPAGGWPVLINLAIIDFKPELGSMVKNRGQCGLDGDIPGGHHGFRRRRLQRGGMTEEFQPFATPDEIMEPCTCFAPNGTYTCKTSADNGHHMAPGAGCSFDILAGGMWFQRQKQYLLANGIAVVVVNARTFDGWNIDNETYDGHRPPSPGANPYESVTEGTDKPFFAALARDMASGKLGLLNPERVAFHGWSGGAQMVSELVDVHARGELTGMTMKAGVMMSGGTQQCYNTPLETPGREPGSPAALAQCAACDGGYDCNTPGCSAHPDPPPPPPPPACAAALAKDCGAAKQRGSSACGECLKENFDRRLQPAGCSPTDAEGYCSAKKPDTPCCNYCCPQGVTESFYMEHPEHYATHPAMFLGQVSHDDNEADGCAAQYYHDTMVAHNATSELHLIPLEQQRTYCVGTPGEFGLPANDRWSIYANTSYNLNCMNHTEGSWEMTEPLTQFLMDHL